MTLIEDLITELRYVSNEEGGQGSAEEQLSLEGWEAVDSEGSYVAYAKDLDFMWRWIILRDDTVVQEGCSISRATTCRSVRHVLAFMASTGRPAVAASE